MKIGCHRFCAESSGPVLDVSLPNVKAGARSMKHASEVLSPAAGDGATRRGGLRSSARPGASVAFSS